MQTRTSFALGCALGLAVASGVFLWRWPRPAPVDGVPTNAAGSQPRGGRARVPVLAAGPACITREELRAELAGVEDRMRAPAPAATPVEARPSEPASPAPRDSAERAAALAQAARLVDLALANRRLTEQDAASLSALAPRLAVKDRNHLRQRLIVAANRDHLEVDLSELNF